MSRDIIQLQLSQHFCCATIIFCRATRVSCRVGVTYVMAFTHLEVAIHDFQFAYFCSVATYDIIFGVVRYIIKHLFYETA